MAEAVKVIVRCRPMNEREKNLNCGTCLFIEGTRAQASIKNPHDEKAPPKNFTFDGAYYVDSTTEQIYSDIGYPLVEGVTEGYNGTIFAYGQTGCGKSFTMQGITDPSTQRGIIPRAFDHIFETVSVSSSTKFLIHASYLEIYNEEVRDLLGKDTKHRLELKEHPEKGVYVNGLSLHPVHNVLECERVMDKGWKNRSVGATLMNADSSRSHSIFTINLEMCTPDEAGEEHIRAGKLNLVDLAGSERQSKTGSTGNRLKEATKINLSLSALGNVISALVDGKSKHIPYRDSKLTRLLQDSLGGNTKTLMVACLSPADNNYDETLSTLRYANRAKNIKNKPKINEDPKDALLREYQAEIEKLKAMLMGQIPVPDGGFEAQQRHDSPAKSHSPGGIDRQQLAEEKARLKEEYEAKIDEMSDLYEEERITKAKLQEDMIKLRQFYDAKVADVEGQLADLPPTAAVLGEIEWNNQKKSEEEHAPGYDGTTVIKPPKQKQSKKKQLKKQVQSLDSIEDEEEKMASDEEEEQYAPDDIEKTNQEVEAIESKELIVGEGGVPYEEQGEDYRTPDASPEGMQEHMSKQQEEALKRLQELQSQMVGGEEANNRVLQERIKKKKQHVEDRNKQLAEALALLDDDGIMRNIYVSIQDELKDKNDAFERSKTKNEEQEREIIDLQAEFQFERIDYLDTIRKQERQLLLMQALLDRIHPCLRKDCNYTNLDKIKMEAKWDEDEEKWLLPKLIINRTALPVADTTLGVSRIESRSQPMVVSPLASPRAHMNGEMQGSHFDYSEDDKLYQRLSGSDKSSYFTPKRASQLLQSTEPVSNFSLQEVKSSVGMSKTRSKLNGEPEVSHGVRAAQVHGQIMNDSEVRKPTRLDALPTLGGRKGKKKKGYDGY